MDTIEHPRLHELEQRSAREMRREARRDPEIRDEGRRFLPSRLVVVLVVLAVLGIAVGAFGMMALINDAAGLSELMEEP